MESIIYTAKPLSRKRFRIFKRVLETRKKITHIESRHFCKGVETIRGKEKEYWTYGPPIDTGIITKKPEAKMKSLQKEDEQKRKNKKH